MANLTTLLYPVSTKETNFLSYTTNKSYTYSSYVNSSVYLGSLFKINGYNGSSTDDYLQIRTANNFLAFCSVIKAKQSFEFTFPNGMINGQFTICNSKTPRHLTLGDPVLILNTTMYNY